MKNCQICKKRKTAVIESWIGMDRVLFEDSKPSRVLSEDKKAEYTELKNTFLLNLFEMYLVLEHINPNNFSDIEELKEYATTKAELAVEFAKNRIREKDVRDLLIQECNGSSEPDKVVKSSYKKIALEAYLFNGIDRELIEAMSEDESGRLMLEAHDKLIEKILEIVVG